MYVTISSPHEGIASDKGLSDRPPTLPLTRLAPERHLYYEGDKVERIYQVKSGVVRLTRLLEDGRRQIIAFGYPGDIVGFPFNGHHHTECETLTRVELQPYLLTHLENGRSDPALHASLLQAALREIAAMQDHFMMLGRKTAQEKLASFLAVLADRVGIKTGEFTQIALPMSRADIADFLGLTTETVSRTFSQLRKNKTIALNGVHVVIIRNRAALNALAEGDHG